MSPTKLDINKIKLKEKEQGQGQGNGKRKGKREKTTKSKAGWWFGTFSIFPYIGNVIIPTDEYFSEG